MKLYNATKDLTQSFLIGYCDKDFKIFTIILTMNNYSFLNLSKSFLTPLAKFQVINNRYLNDNIWDENDLKSLIKHQYFCGKSV